MTQRNQGSRTVGVQTIGRSAHHEAMGGRCGCSSRSGARPFAFRGTEKQFTEDQPFRTIEIKAKLRLDLQKKCVEGTATLSFDRLQKDATKLVLDGVGLDVRSAKLDGAPLEFVNDGEKITFVIPAALDKFSVSLTYKASPKRGMYFLEPDEKVPKRPRQVWTQCQEEDAKYFLPCVDTPRIKFRTEFEITVPKGFSVLSNGVLEKQEQPANGEWTYTWKMNDPLPTYLLSIVAGEFDVIEEAKAIVPVTYYVPKNKAEEGKRTFRNTPAMLAFFSEKTGFKFPWNKYAQVVVSDFIFGGMENTTATTMYEHILLDKKAELDITSDDLIAHELAHHWFGDLVTCRDWSEGWLNEGFATFFEHVWREHLLGRDEYEVGIRADLDAYISEASGRYRRPIVCRTYDAPLDLFDRHLYEKGGLVLHLLRMDLGDTFFWKGVSIYLERHAHSSVETRDLQRAMEEVSGRELGAFFDQWVHSPGHPEVDVKVDYADGLVKVSVEQTQSDADQVPSVFRFPLEIEITVDGQTTVERWNVTKRNEQFFLPQKKRPESIVVDPSMRILGTVKTTLANDWIRKALQSASTARGRWLSANLLATAVDKPSIEALAATLKNAKEFWRVRVSCADALGSNRSKEALEVLLANTSVEHPKVRRAVARALGSFRNEKAYAALFPLSQEDDSYLVESEALRSLGKTRQPKAWTSLTAAVDRPSWADVVSAACIDGMVELKDERVEPILLRKGAYGTPTRVRRAAIDGIPRVLPERKAREVLEEWLEDADPHLRIDVARALEELGDGKARGALARQMDRDLDPRVRRAIREVLRDLGGDSRGDVRELKEELEKLRSDASSMKMKLSEMEAMLKDVRTSSTKQETTDSDGSAKASPEHGTKKKKKSES